MKAIELFAGIGGFRLAADANGIKTVWANDICAKACKVYEDRFGKGSIAPGDIRELMEEIPDHDILTGGFPCQPFSAAGKKKGINDPRGTLFQSIVEVVDSKKPKYFVLENVKRLLTMEKGLHFATILSSLSELGYQIEWRLLNAMDLGLPQNRQRVFIVGTRRQDETRIRLATQKEVSTIPADERESLSDRTAWSKIEDHGKRFPDWGVSLDGKFFGADIEFTSNRRPLKRLKSVLQDTTGPEFDFTESTLKWLKDNTPVDRFVQGVEILSNQAGGARMGYTIFGINGVAPTLTSTTSRHYERYSIDGRYRRLTNIEYARIQGFPDDHCSAVSVYDQYALFGNAVPPKMAEWVIGRVLTNGMTFNEPERKRQRRLFDNANEGTTEKASA